jgi:hypothetical protein
LDRESVIFQPAELLESFNDEPGSIPQIVIQTLVSSRRRDLGMEEVEKLRRAEAVLALFPGVEDRYDELYSEQDHARGIDYVEELHTVVRAAELDYKPQQEN